MTNALNSTTRILSEAHDFLNEIERIGLRSAVIERDGWRLSPAGFGHQQHGYASYGHGKADYEVIIGHESGVSVILRTYDGKRRATWCFEDRENVGHDVAAAELTNFYCRQAKAEEPAPEPTYEDWDAERREVFGQFNPSYDHVEVVHGEYETAAYYGASGGRVVASWDQSTGRGRVDTVEQFANDLANDVRNYIINAVE